jgi:hypothetical protein
MLGRSLHGESGNAIGVVDSLGMLDKNLDMIYIILNIDI